MSRAGARRNVVAATVDGPAAINHVGTPQQPAVSTTSPAKPTPKSVTKTRA